MKLSDLRYKLTEHVKKVFFTYDNYRLLIHPSISYDDLIDNIKDDIEMMPELKDTIDNIEIKFYQSNYDEKIYLKSELLSFIFASIDKDWNVICGVDNRISTHYWLEKDDIVYDPSLAIITRKDIYYNYFNKRNVIVNENIFNYLIKYNNLYKYYNKKLFIFNKSNKFSIDYINSIVNEFNNNINNQYIIDDMHIKEIIHDRFSDDFVRLRMALTKKRKYYITSSNISIHPDIDKSILDIIKKDSGNIQEIMKSEYDMDIDYYNYTLGNCYGLSILYNLYNEKFKLVQGGIYLDGENKKNFYQHSWLEYGDIIYDPSFKIVTKKELYYLFFVKQDEYSKEDTENMLRRIGFNLTHFRDFLDCKQIGNDETIRYRYSVNKIDSPKLRNEGEELINNINKVRRRK